MKQKLAKQLIDRRRFLHVSATAVGGSGAFWAGRTPLVQGAKESLPIRNRRSTMTYRKLGRTEIVCSRLVFGCGAALAGGKAVRLLDRALEAGINFYDVGSNVYYKGSENSLAPFMKAHRDEIWVVSKAPARIRAKADEEVSVDEAKAAARSWSGLLDDSLRDLSTDYVDAYYLMAVNNPSLIKSEEILKAAATARDAGKMGYFGLSTHNNAQKTLQAAAQTGAYDLAMIAITPGGWYDWDSKRLQEGTATLVQLQSVLQEARDSGIGLIGMKAARFLAPATAMGSGESNAFDSFYDSRALSWPLNSFQRSYAYLLSNGIDVVNADMQNFKHLEENLAAASPKNKFLV